MRWNAPNRRAVVQHRMQISTLQTYRHTSSKPIQTCRPAGVKNYMLADVFFFSSLFPFLLCLCVLFLKKHTRLPPHRHRTAQNPGGYSIYPWVGGCGSAPHTLTLFKTKIADFPTLFKTEFRFLIPSLRHS